MVGSCLVVSHKCNLTVTTRSLDLVFQQKDGLKNKKDLNYTKNKNSMN